MHLGLALPPDQVPKRVSTTVCREAARRAREGTRLGIGLHCRELQDLTADPAVHQVCLRMVLWMGMRVWSCRSHLSVRVGCSDC